MSDSAPSARGKSLRWLLLVLAGLAAVWLFARKPIQREITLRLVVHEDSPSPEVLAELVDQAKAPMPVIEKLWSSRKIVQRELVASYIKGRIEKDQALRSQSEDLLVEAARDADASVREQALGALSLVHSPRLLPAALEQLSDADPLLRQLGLQYLAEAPSQAKRLVPVMIGLLDDPDPRVAAFAEGILTRWTEVDFGVRRRDAVLVHDDRTGQEHFDPVKLERMREGIRRRKEWWRGQSSGFKSAPIDLPRIPGPLKIPAGDFDLPDLTGKRIHLSDFKGKKVLINFWTTWCTACLAEMPGLVALQKKYAGQLVILGVSLDAIPDEHGHIGGHLHEGAEDKHGHDEPGEGKEKLRRKVAGTAAARGLNYPVLLDVENQLGARFNGGELPTNVLIDEEGYVRRRFIGARPLAAWVAMIRAMDGHANSKNN